MELLNEKNTFRIYDFTEALLDDLFHIVIEQREFPEPALMVEKVNELLERNKHLEDHCAEEFRKTIAWATGYINTSELKQRILSELLFDTTSDPEMRDHYNKLLDDLTKEWVPDDLLAEVTFCPELAPFLRSPCTFLLALQTNHVAVLNSGITRGIKLELFNLLKDIWRNAVRHIHPFQKGATHQGTHHCHVVNKKLNEIGSKSGLNFDDLEGLGDVLTREEGFVLKVAAAVHDLGKAHIQGDIDHASTGYNFILNQSSDLLIPKGLEKSVALVVKYHDGTEALDSTASLLSDKLNVQFIADGETQNFDIRLRHLAAIFRLADVMDMTHERVSDVVYRISSTCPPPLKYENERKIVNRRCIKSVDINITNKRIDIIAFPGLSSSDITRLDAGINYENAILKLSTTSTILDGISIPWQFYKI